MRKVTMLNLVAIIVMRGHGAAGLSNLTGEKGRRHDVPALQARISVGMARSQC